MSLKEKLNVVQNEEQQTDLARLLQQTTELNDLMRSYIRVQMDRETVNKITIDKELTEIKDTSEQAQANMTSVLTKQKEMLTAYGESLQRIMATGQTEMKENNRETLTKLSAIETFLQERMRQIKSQTSQMVSHARKNILINHWLDALKYGGVAAFLVGLVIYVMNLFGVFKS